MVTLHLRVQSDSPPMSMWVPLGHLHWCGSTVHGLKGGEGLIRPLTSPFSVVLFLLPSIHKCWLAVSGFMYSWFKFPGMSGSPCPTYIHFIPPANTFPQSWVLAEALVPCLTLGQYVWGPPSFPSNPNAALQIHFHASYWHSARNK